MKTDDVDIATELSILTGVYEVPDSELAIVKYIEELEAKIAPLEDEIEAWRDAFK